MYLLQRSRRTGCFLNLYLPRESIRVMVSTSDLSESLICLQDAHLNLWFKDESAYGAGGRCSSDKLTFYNTPFSLPLTFLKFIIQHNEQYFSWLLINHRCVSFSCSRVVFKTVDSIDSTAADKTHGCIHIVP